MKIANPLYDYAFKYLMSNDRLAKKVLSTILDKEILELELSPQETVVHNEIRHFTLYRLDFKALVRDKDGKQENILIEIQKSKLPTNLLRFRNYLGMTYAQSQAKESDKLFPIVTIYILGYQVEDIPYLATKVDRKIINTSTKEEVHIQSDFIDLLTHTCYILQAGRLPEKRKEKIEQFMTLFNQSWVMDKRYIIDLHEIPEDFKDIAEYLQQPLLDQETVRNMDAEQEIDNLFAKQESEIELYKALTEKSQIALVEAKAREKESKAREEEANVLIKNMIAIMKQQGLDKDEIQTSLGMNIDKYWE